MAGTPRSEPPRRRLRRASTGLSALAVAGALLGPGLSAGPAQAATHQGTAPAATAPAPSRPAAASTTVPTTGTVTVVVSATVGGREAVRHAVTAAGGRITRTLSIIDGFAATVPARAVPALRENPAVRGLSVNGRVSYASVDPALGYDAENDAKVGSMYQISQIVGAQAAWKDGVSGKGVDVALIDTGISPVAGLDATDKVVQGPDLSFDSQSRNLTHLDAFGHGTHMASLIAGRDVERSDPAEYAGDTGSFNGIAPDARLVNVKVGASDGATDVSQVIAALDWVVQHRSDPGMNIRVVNLSFGTSSSQSYLVDPLAYAAEQAVAHGLVLVVSGGNEGGTVSTLANPAYDPAVIAVGASDSHGTLVTTDDTIPDFANNGSASRKVDVVAPGVSVIGLRDPDGLIDQEYPTARVGDRFFRGSGTSQSAAIVSGAAALLLQQNPDWSPARVKNALMASGQEMADGVSSRFAGKGVIQAADAFTATMPEQQPWEPSTGTGSLETARGGIHVSQDGVELTGEQDIFGAPFDAGHIAATEASAASWFGGTWNGNVWSGDEWAGSGWAGRAWSSTSWAGRAWSSEEWDGNVWDGRAWSGRAWSGRAWSGNTWDGRAWSGRAWSGRAWSSSDWS